MSSDSSVAIITGGSRGIGFAISKVLAARGSQIVIPGIDEQGAIAAAAEIAALDGELDRLQVEVRVGHPSADPFDDGGRVRQPARRGEVADPTQARRW